MRKRKRSKRHRYTKARNPRRHRRMYANKRRARNPRRSIAAIKRRLEYLRREIEAERISYGEIAELQSLAKYIEPGDMLLLEWAGVPEHKARKWRKRSNPYRIEVWRRPTKGEIKFGYGALHYRNITVKKPPKGGQKFKLDGKTYTYGSKRG